MSGQAAIRLRPHHLLCALGFEGKGYSDSFTANMARLVVRLNASGGAAEVMIAPAADDICAPCPRRRGSGCTEQDRINTLDARHAAALALEPGARLTWGAAQDRIRERVAPGSLGTLCTGCQWLELGACERALARLHASGAGQDLADLVADEGVEPSRP